MTRVTAGPPEASRRAARSTGPADGGTTNQPEERSSPHPLHCRRWPGLLRRGLHHIPASVAQGIEHSSPKAGVAGSNPAGGTTYDQADLRIPSSGNSGRPRTYRPRPFACADAELLPSFAPGSPGGPAPTTGRSAVGRHSFDSGNVQFRKDPRAFAARAWARGWLPTRVVALLVVMGPGAWCAHSGFLAGRACRA